MTNYVINKNSTETLTIDGTNNAWFINSDVTLEVAGPAILGEADDDSNDVIIYGKVISKGESSAVSIEGDFDFVHVDGGSVTARQGAGVFFGEGAGNTLLNEGVISGKQFGFLGSATDIEIDNAGEIRSAGIAIKTGSDFESGLTLDNAGIIETKGKIAILGGAGVEVIHNDGRIVGDVKLGGSADQFFFGKGTVDGRVFGGAGGDIYVLGKGGGEIVETADGGIDYVHSGRTAVLGDNLDRLLLLGNKDIAGTGNALINYLTGNKGDNMLQARGGADVLDGGSGNDDLVGGGGGDMFILKYGSGRDRVLDFQVEGEFHDMIDLSNYYPGGSPADYFSVKSHLSQHGKDTWIDYGDGDRMVLRNVDKDDLDSSHFSFSLL